MPSSLSRCGSYSSRVGFRVTLLTAATTLLLLVGAVSAQNSTECFTSLRSLNQVLVDKDPFVMQTYTLCPNTVFRVGDNLGIDVGFINGDEPLRPRSNAEIRCGETGSSLNNCTIVGGDAQFQMFTAHHPEVQRENVVVKGITYESVTPTRVAVAIVAPGFIEFRDCVFKVRSLRCAVFCVGKSLACIGGSWRAVLLAGHRVSPHCPPHFCSHFILSPQYHFNAQVAAIIFQPFEEGEFLEVTFDGCLFENNSLFRDGSAISSALIGGGSSVTTVVIRNSVFANNNLKDELFFRSDLVEVEADITMENNCFINNHVTGDGVVRVSDGGDVLSTRGNSGTRIEGASCDFLVVEADTEDSSPSCWQYDFPSCVLNYTNGRLIPPEPGFVPEPFAPTPSPVASMPVMKPSSAPSLQYFMGVLCLAAAALL